MAYRKSKGKARRTKKIEPSVQTMLFNTQSTAAGANQVLTSYIDLSQCASLLNRRFYRQGINWAVSAIKIYSGVPGSVTVSKLPNTWVMSNAWEKGFRQWQKMNNEALADSESLRPRFLDFKIYADKDHHDVGFGANLLPKSIGDANAFPAVLNTAAPGEWEPSQYHIPSSSPGVLAADREIIAVGPNYPGASTATGFNAVSLIEGYAAGRALPNVLDPNVPDDMSDADGATPQNWQTALFNDGTQQDSDVLEDMRTDNNIAPYPYENDGVNPDTMYPGGANQLQGMELHAIGSITGTTIGGQTHLRGGMFPCGIIRIDHTTSDTAANLAVVVELMPGNHRGYLCEPMTDM